MLPFQPVRRRHSLGQFEELTSGITSNLARQIVAGAEPAVRRIVKEERNRFAEALIGAIPFGVISTLAFVASKYVVPPDAKAAKAVGYVVSAVAAAGGAWWTISKLQTGEAIPASPGGPTSLDPIVGRAAQTIVAEAEPKVRAIVDDERRRIAEAGLAGLPFAIGAAATFLATFFLVEPDDKLVKAAGYTGTTLLLGLGAWFALDKEREAA